VRKRKAFIKRWRDDPLRDRPASGGNLFLPHEGEEQLVRMTAIILRISALLALILGMLFWAGQVESLVDAHMLLDLLVALSLWVLGQRWR